MASAANDLVGTITSCRWQRKTQSFPIRGILTTMPPQPSNYQHLPTAPEDRDSHSEHPALPYQAGHWHDNFLQSLGWIRDKLGGKASVQQAPSWSWASQSGGISYGEMGDAPGAMFDCKVLHVDTELNSNSVSGTVAGGELYLEARALRGEVCCWTEPGYGQIAGLDALVVFDDDHTGSRTFTDLLMRENLAAAYFLLVEGAHEGGKYRRIGIAKLCHSESYGSWRSLPVIKLHFEYMDRGIFQIV